MSPPASRLPSGSCDCHMHIFDPRFPTRPGAMRRDAPVPAYRALAAELGITRNVIVQPSGHGFDNACTLDALAAMGPDTRAVVVIPPDTPRAELERLHALGVRGVRFFMIRPGFLGWDELQAVSERVAPLGWHVIVQFDGHQLPERAASLRSAACDVVVDHIGSFHGGATPGDAGFRALLALMESGRVWVKLSAPYTYRMSASGAPAFPEVGPVARALVREFPQRCLWATDWPHVSEAEMPSDRMLLQAFDAWVDDGATRQRILVDNPAQLYGFPTA